MSPEADVLEMKSLLEELAEAVLPRATIKAQATALQREFRKPSGEPLFTWNRVYELLRGRARRVDGFEKENAERRVAALKMRRDAHALEKSQANYRLLEARLAALEALYERIDPEFLGEQVAGHRSQSRGQS